LAFKGKDLVELLLRRLGQRLVEGDPSVVHQDVESPKALHRFANQATGPGNLAHVGLYRDRLATGLGDFGHGVVGTRLV
jgi:hypothetical protein